MMRVIVFSRMRLLLFYRQHIILAENVSIINFNPNFFLQALADLLQNSKLIKDLHRFCKTHDSNPCFFFVFFFACFYHHQNFNITTLKIEDHLLFDFPFIYFCKYFSSKWTYREMVSFHILLRYPVRAYFYSRSSLLWISNKHFSHTFIFTCLIVIFGIENDFYS